MDGEITKEKTITYGCNEGFHQFSPGSAMMGSHNGVVELRLRCELCGVQVAEPSPIKGLQLAGKVLDKVQEEGTMEQVQVEKPEELKMSEDPFKNINEGSLETPIWAEQVKSRYKQDKALDNFFDEIRELASK